MTRIWLIGLVIALGISAANTGHCLLPVGDAVPDFKVRTLESPAPVASKELFEADTHTLLSFFATWCKPCEKEIPELRHLAERFKTRGFRVVLVSLDHGEPGEIQEFLDDAKSGDLPIVWDGEGELMALFEVFNLPTNILVGKDGKITMAWQGYLPDKLKELEARLEKLPD